MPPPYAELHVGGPAAPQQSPAWPANTARARQSSLLPPARESVARSPSTSCRLLQRVGSSSLVKHLDVHVKALYSDYRTDGIAGPSL